MMRRRIHRPGSVGGMSGPFDSVNDMAAAYSMRRLRGSYTGPMVRLRRASDNAEADFGDGLNLLNFSEISAWAGGNAFATTFYDQSGLGRNLTQSTAANQPQIILAANGRPALLFDGSNDTMVTAAFTRNQPHSFNIVYRRVAGAGASTYVADGLSADTMALLRDSPNADNAIYAGAQLNGDFGTSMPTGTRGAVGATFNGTSSLIETNAATIASAFGSAGTGNASGLTVGARGGAIFFMNMEAQELILFSSAHTSAQLKADNAAMRAAWNF